MGLVHDKIVKLAKAVFDCHPPPKKNTAITPLAYPIGSKGPRSPWSLYLKPMLSLAA